MKSSLRPALVESPVAGVEPVVSPTDPVIGVWWVDKSKGHYDRPTPSSVKRYGTTAPHGSELGKWVFTPEGQGVRLQHFTGSGPDSPNAALTDFFSTWDGRPWADPLGPAFLGQLVQHWRLHPCLIVRLILDNVAPPERLEWMTYAVSPDGKTLAVTSWDPASPEHHDLQVFNKQDDQIRDAQLQTSGVPPRTSWKIDPHLTIRRVSTEKGRSTWTLDAIAADGSSLVVTSWDEATPHDQHIQVQPAPRTS